jgi:hypothetical protein
VRQAQRLELVLALVLVLVLAQQLALVRELALERLGRLRHHSLGPPLQASRRHHASTANRHHSSTAGRLNR